MKPAPFQYARPANAQEAVDLLQRHTDMARLLAGGQSLVPMMNFRIARPEVLIDLNACGDMAFIERAGDHLRIGAMTRQRVVEQDPHVREMCPLLTLTLENAGPVPVRNRGTVGGMLANCYPTADLVCAALCLDVQLEALGPSGTRKISASEFFIAEFTTGLEPDELLFAFSIHCKAGRRYAYEKISDHAAGAPAVAVALAAVPPKSASDGWTDVAASALGFDSVAIRLPELEQGLSSTSEPSAAQVTQWLADDMTNRGFDPTAPDPAYKIRAATALVCRSLPALLPAGRWS